MASEQKEKLIRFYKGTEGEETVVKLVDLAEAVQRSQKFRLSGFLDPYGQEIAETVAANYPRACDVHPRGLRRHARWL